LIGPDWSEEQLLPPLIEMQPEIVYFRPNRRCFIRCSACGSADGVAEAGKSEGTKIRVAAPA
jgi:hypothetical protein